MAAEKDGVIALNRFGLGCRPGDLLAFGADAKGALLDDITKHASLVPLGERIVSSADAFHRFRVEAGEIKAARQAAGGAAETPGSSPQGQARTSEKASPPVPDQAGTAGESDGKMAGAKPAGNPNPFKRSVPGDIFRAETQARVDAALAAKTGFAERLVLFWSNHFCVSARKSGELRVLAGSYEREAIRPHVFGRFADMLLAVEKHPAMLAYLDNVQSIGPNSVTGRRQQKGLNENLAREIMELHTLGVDGGYTQADVTSLARILTGWRFARQDNAIGQEGRFVFNVKLHDPGDQTLLGSSYRDEGVSQGETALLALARHPATARRIARKLAAHFESDAPSASLTAKLEKTFRETDGDLGAVSRALIEAPEAWVAERTKMRTPYEFLVASMRATGASLKPQQMNGALISMGEPLWSPPGPNGFPDTASAWVSPEGMKARLDVATQIAASIPGDAKPGDVLVELMGPVASEETKMAVAGAESRAQGFTLLLMSPEFQRR